jgi:hypothetical protein
MINRKAISCLIQKSQVEYCYSLIIPITYKFIESGELQRDNEIRRSPLHTFVILSSKYKTEGIFIKQPSKNVKIPVQLLFHITAVLLNKT